VSSSSHSNPGELPTREHHPLFSTHNKSRGRFVALNFALVRLPTYFCRSPPYPRSRRGSTDNIIRRCKLLSPPWIWRHFPTRFLGHGETFEVLRFCHQFFMIHLGRLEACSDFSSLLCAALGSTIPMAPPLAFLIPSKTAPRTQIVLSFRLAQNPPHFVFPKRV
jgi:hypothetical protein